MRADWVRFSFVQLYGFIILLYLCYPEHVLLSALVCDMWTCFVACSPAPPPTPTRPRVTSVHSGPCATARHTRARGGDIQTPVQLGCTAAWYMLYGFTCSFAQPSLSLAIHISVLVSVGERLMASLPLGLAMLSCASEHPRRHPQSHAEVHAQ